MTFPLSLLTAEQRGRSPPIHTTVNLGRIYPSPITVELTSFFPGTTILAATSRHWRCTTHCCSSEMIYTAVMEGLECKEQQRGREGGVY